MHNIHFMCVFVTLKFCLRGRKPRATVKQVILEAERHMLECSTNTPEITVLLHGSVQCFCFKYYTTEKGFVRVYLQAVNS